MSVCRARLQSVGLCCREGGAGGVGGGGMQGVGVLVAGQDIPLRVSGTQKKRLLSFVQHLSGHWGRSGCLSLGAS